MKAGQKVTYKSYKKLVHGIVKSISDIEHVFVVYNCNEEWHKYFNYTAERTKIKDLVVGWNTWGDEL